MRLPKELAFPFLHSVRRSATSGHCVSAICDLLLRSRHGTRTEQARNALGVDSVHAPCPLRMQALQADCTFARFFPPEPALARPDAQSGFSESGKHAETAYALPAALSAKSEGNHFGSRGRAQK